MTPEMLYLTITNSSEQNLFKQMAHLAKQFYFYRRTYQLTFQFYLLDENTSHGWFSFRRSRYIVNELF